MYGSFAMHNSLVSSLYPEKLVPPHIMNHAASLYEILDFLHYDVSGGTISLSYINNWTLVKLWCCTLTFTWSECMVSNFFTANLTGINNWFKSKSAASSDIHVLQTPIPYIWKVLFGKILELCRTKNISSLWLTPLKFTDSPKFYEKMIEYYPDIISETITDEWWDIYFILT